MNKEKVIDITGGKVLYKDLRDRIENQSVPSGGTNGQMLVKDGSTDYATKWANAPTVPVQDVQVNGTSILNQGVANIPYATADTTYGVTCPESYRGITVANNKLSINPAADSDIKYGTLGNAYKPITATLQHKSTFYGLAKAAGDSTQSSSSNAVGQYTDAAKAAIQSMLGVSQMLAPVNANMTAAQAYAIGDVFAANGKLYKATAAIAQDGAIIPDTNCVETTMADESVRDVQVNGVSILSNGVASIPIASSDTPGVAKVNSLADKGLGIISNELTIIQASDTLIKIGTNTFKPVTPSKQHMSVFYGLSKVAGVDLANETVTLGTYPVASQTAIKAMLGVEEGLKVVRLI